MSEMVGAVVGRVADNDVLVGHGGGQGDRGGEGRFRVRILGFKGTPWLAALKEEGA